MIRRVIVYGDLIGFRTEIPIEKLLLQALMRLIIGCQLRNRPPPVMDLAVDLRGERGSGGGGFFDSQSKADEVDNWAASKSNNRIPNGAPPPRRFGAGFDRRSSFYSLQSRDSPRDLDNWGKKKEEAGSGAAGSGGARPKIVLQPSTIPVTEDSTVPKPKGANPFGEARPREEVLKGKGKDWKEIDEKLEAMKIKEAVTVMEKERERKKSFVNGHAPAEKSWRKSEPVEAVADADQPQRFLQLTEI
ncbi:Non-imprinted in Prader-Willi/Angelman syndrome region protein [Hibiscus syriacus]|uniref:Non-imprinted in Prader-Willi/Angelman syndrome region protein n=1 Tax=Hibiscus syriacus TaxID=106335 RepID=A0A6A3CP31_HIBSY|nr:Non-imprinted in Prader-Willi/Angelman syndrome region protein [Hibiscus syriacus]